MRRRGRRALLLPGGARYDPRADGAAPGGVRQHGVRVKAQRELAVIDRHPWKSRVFGEGVGGEQLLFPEGEQEDPEVRPVLLEGAMKARRQKPLKACNEAPSLLHSCVISS